MKNMKKNSLLPPPVPAGCRKTDSIDLLRNKKEFWTVNLLSVLLMMFCVAWLQLRVPVATLAWERCMLPLLLISVGSLLYIILHEAVHGVVMYLFTRQKPSFGYGFGFAWAGSTDWFTKKQYVVVALAPLVFWGIVLAIPMAVTGGWAYWVLGILQMENISGSAGDLYVTGRILRMGKDVQINDTGTVMTVIVREKAEQ